MSVPSHEEIIMNENDEQLEILQRKTKALKEVCNTLFYWYLVQ